MRQVDVAGVAFRSDSPELLERGVDNVLWLYPSRAGVALTPSSATVTVRDRAGNVVVTGSATCENGRAAYTLLAAATADLQLDMGWTVTWTVRLQGESVDRVVPNEAALVLHRIYPVVADADLWGRVPALNPDGAAPITSYRTFEPFRLDAWTTIHERLVEDVRRPWLAMSPSSFREVHLLLSLARIFADAGQSRAVAEYTTAAKDYERKFERAWGRLQWVYDATETGSAAGDRDPVAMSLWLGGRM